MHFPCLSNIVLHTPCLVKTCVYNAEATASAETLFNGNNITYMLNISMTIRQYLFPKLSHWKGPEISARILKKNHTIQDNAMVIYSDVLFFYSSGSPYIAYNTTVYTSTN